MWATTKNDGFCRLFLFVNEVHLVDFLTKLNRDFDRNQSLCFCYPRRRGSRAGRREIGLTIMRLFTENDFHFVIRNAIIALITSENRPRII